MARVLLGAHTSILFDEREQGVLLATLVWCSSGNPGLRSQVFDFSSLASVVDGGKHGALRPGGDMKLTYGGADSEQESHGSEQGTS